MRNPYGVPARLGIALAALLLLAACGQPKGPSAAEARLDVQDRMNAAYKGMLKLTDFAVTDREALSETRVKLYIATRFTLDKERVQQYKQQQVQSSRLFGAGNFRRIDRARRMVQRFGGAAQTGVQLYERNNAGMWRLTRMAD